MKKILDLILQVVLAINTIDLSVRRLPGPDPEAGVATTDGEEPPLRRRLRLQGEVPESHVNCKELAQLFNTLFSYVLKSDLQSC